MTAHTPTAYGMCPTCTENPTISRPPTQASFRSAESLTDSDLAAMNEYFGGRMPGHPQTWAWGDDGYNGSQESSDKSSIRPWSPFCSNRRDSLASYTEAPGEAATIKKPLEYWYGGENYVRGNTPEDLSFPISSMPHLQGWLLLGQRLKARGVGDEEESR